MEFKYQNEPIFFPLKIQGSIHGKFKTRKLINFLDSQYRFVICRNVIYVINEQEIVQPKLKELTDCIRNDPNGDDIQSDIIEELIHVETDALVLNENTYKSEQPDEKTEE